MLFTRTFLSIILLNLSLALFAQKEGTLKTQEYTVEKVKTLEVLPANRSYGKPQPILALRDTSKALTYEFSEVKIFNQMKPVLYTPPGIIPPRPDSTEKINLQNMLILGIGNYGRIYADAFLTSRKENPFVITGRIIHLSQANGPVEDSKSCSSNNELHLTGRYLSKNIGIEGGIEYQRQGLNFYGYKLPELKTIETDQSYNRITANISLNNNKSSSVIDYQIGTNFSYLFDRFEASEKLWHGTLRASMKITPQFTSLLNAELNTSEYVNKYQNEKRNLVKISPLFRYDFQKRLWLTLGANITSDVSSLRNESTLFPYVMVNFALTPTSNLFVSYEGDKSFVSLHKLSIENPFLASNIPLLNTTTNNSFTAGVRGVLPNLFQYEIKTNWSKVSDLYFYANSRADSAKFSLLYEPEAINVWKLSGSLHYEVGEKWSVGTHFNYNQFVVKNIEKPFHRPSFQMNLYGRVYFNKKVSIQSHFFLISGLYGKNLNSGSSAPLQIISDLNFTTIYQLSPNIGLNILVNNLFGDTYQYYYNYPVMSTNFLVSVLVKFNSKWNKNSQPHASIVP